MRQRLALLWILLACHATAMAQHAPALELELPELDGNQFVHLSSYAGRPMVLNFWASYCPPCVAEMPMLMAEAPRYPGVQFLGIAVEERLKARNFLQTLQPSYPQLVAPLQTEGILRRFGNGSGALPYTVVLDAGHRACRTHAGGIDAAWLAQALRACAPAGK